MPGDGAQEIMNHPVVSREEWLAARTALLAKEKEFTRQRDALSHERRALPWVGQKRKHRLGRGGDPGLKLDDDVARVAGHAPAMSPPCARAPGERIRSRPRP